MIEHVRTNTYFQRDSKWCEMRKNVTLKLIFPWNDASFSLMHLINPLNTFRFWYSFRFCLNLNYLVLSQLYHFYTTFILKSRKLFILFMTVQTFVYLLLKIKFFLHCCTITQHVKDLKANSMILSFKTNSP